MEQLSEREYRLLKQDSYSTLKKFVDDPLVYEKEIIQGIKSKTDIGQTSDDARFGSLVDCLLLTKDDFSDKFVVTDSELPKGQMGIFVKAALEKTKEGFNEFGDQTKTMETILEEAYAEVVLANKDKKVRGTLKVFSDKFQVEKEGWQYYQDFLVKGDKIIVTKTEVGYAENLVTYILTHPYTSKYFKAIKNVKGFNQFILTDELFGLPIKIMADRILVDVKHKRILPLDLKVVGSIPSFNYNFFNFRYYIQLCVYTTVLRQFYPDHTVLPLSFMIVDKFKKQDPIIFKPSEEDYQKTLNGFTSNGFKYKGVKQIVDEILYLRNSEIWTSSMEAQQNEGVVHLNLID